MSKKNPLPYEVLTNQRLSEDDVERLDHNLIRFVELLIKLDKQQKQSKETNQL